MEELFFLLSRPSFFMLVILPHIREVFPHVRMHSLAQESVLSCKAQWKPARDCILSHEALHFLVQIWAFSHIELDSKAKRIFYPSWNFLVWVGSSSCNVAHFLVLRCTSSHETIVALSCIENRVYLHYFSQNTFA